MGKSNKTSILSLGPEARNLAQTFRRRTLKEAGVASLKELKEVKPMLYFDYIDAREELVMWVRDRKSQNKSVGTYKQFKAHMEGNRISTFFANMGLGVDEVAAELSVPEEALLDGSNWTGDVFTYDGKSIEFTFTYNNSGYYHILGGAD